MLPLLVGLLGVHGCVGLSSDFARIVMAAYSRWDVMKMEDPGDWHTALAANNLVVANAKTVAACRAEAAKTHKPQECRIVVKAPK